MIERSYSLPYQSMRRVLEARWRSIILFSLAVVTGLTGWLLFRPVEYVPGEVKEWARQAQKTAALWSVTPIDTIDGQREAHRFLTSRLPVPDGAQQDRTVLDQGVKHLVQFLIARSSASLDEYTEWARLQGLEIRNAWPHEPRFKEESFQSAYRRSLDIDNLEIKCTPAQFFRDIYQHNITAGDGAYVPVGISTGNDAAYISVATFTHPSDTFDYHDDLLTKPPGIEFWVGGISWSWLRFTEPPNTMTDIIDKHGEATVMRVLLLTVGPTGLAMPTDIYQCYDPDRKQWFVYRALQTNFGPTVGTGPKEDTWFVY